MRLFNLLKLVFTKLKTMNDTVTSITNNVYHTTKTVAGVIGKNFTASTLKISTLGTYLVIGTISSNVDGGSSSLLASDLSVVSGATTIITGRGRATMNAGGGCHAWAIVNVTSEATINLVSYGYYKGSCNYTGRIVAIRLI